MLIYYEKENRKRITNETIINDKRLAIYTSSMIQTIRNQMMR